jgi:hypothetical protein
MDNLARSLFRTLFALGLVAATLILPSWAQLQEDRMSSPVMETKDEIPPEQLPPAQKMTGIGNAHIEISATPEAQAWFDQGLNLLHDFWDYESARAFEQSVRSDPQCAMCYWGLYRAEQYYHSTAPDYAAISLAKAVSLEGHASARERFYRGGCSGPIRFDRSGPRPSLYKISDVLASTGRAKSHRHSSAHLSRARDGHGKQRRCIDSRRRAENRS